MAVTDDQVAALRAYFGAKTDAEASDAARRFLTLSGTGRLDEVGALGLRRLRGLARTR
jgi:hypothetical protein